MPGVLAKTRLEKRARFLGARIEGEAIENTEVGGKAVISRPRGQA